MRRVARRRLGIEVEVILGQPPLVEIVDDQPIELRYFFCGLSADAPQRGAYADIRWIPKAHLCEYDFDPPSESVARWLLDSGK